MEKYKGIIFQTYLTWILCNILFVLLPIGLTVIFEHYENAINLPVIYSSIVSSIFGLLIVSMYSNYPFEDMKIEIKSKTISIDRDLITFGSWFIVILVIAGFILYNTIPQLQHEVNSKPIYWILLIVPLILGVIVNVSAIRRLIEAKIKSNMNDGFKRSGKRRELWERELGKGGKNGR